MAESSQKRVAQTLANQGHVALSGFVMSIDKDRYSSLSLDIQPPDLKEYWEAIRDGGFYPHSSIIAPHALP